MDGGMGVIEILIILYFGLINLVTCMNLSGIITKKITRNLSTCGGKESGTIWNEQSIGGLLI
jgi:hypothetical protein